MKAICFDMDGVIVDSEDYWVELEDEEIFPAVGVDVPTDEITGMNYRDMYDYLAENYEVRVEKEAFVDIYEEVARELYSERVALMDGFADLLSDLRGQGRQVALVSSSPPHWIERVLERFDLEFDAVVSAAHVDGPGKPAPAIYRHAAARLETDPARCVAVEDSTHGVASARAAGMDCVGYRTSVNRGQDLSAANAVAEGPEALRKTLLSWD